MPQECKIGENSMILGGNSLGLSLAGPFLLTLCGFETDALFYFIFFPSESKALSADRMDEEALLVKTITVYSENTFHYETRAVAMM